MLVYFSSKRLEAPNIFGRDELSEPFIFASITSWVLVARCIVPCKRYPDVSQVWLVTFEHVPPDLTSEQHQKFTLNKITYSTKL